MNAYLEHINTIVPESLHHKYHLILGNQILGTYDTVEEMTNAERNDFPFVSCVKYLPL